MKKEVHPATDLPRNEPVNAGDGIRRPKIAAAASASDRIRIGMMYSNGLSLVMSISPATDTAK